MKLYASFLWFFSKNLLMFLDSKGIIVREMTFLLLLDLPSYFSTVRSSPMSKFIHFSSCFDIRIFFLLYLTNNELMFFWDDCSINTVYYMAPFATMILAVPAMLLEGPGVVKWILTCPSLFSSLVIIFGSGVLAFCLNFSIFYVIHSTTAVTFNVAGNLKVRVYLTLEIYSISSWILSCTSTKILYLM